MTVRIAIIADDLTGANDSGVQFARSGLKSAVLLSMEDGGDPDDDVVVIDTDSRSASAEEAYRKVRDASEYVASGGFDVVFKKIDSTLRGNIGAEFDALFDVFEPDFIVCTPAYPEYSRQVRDGHLYLGGKLLHETEFALDPKTPIHESSILERIEGQSERRAGLITIGDLGRGEEHLREKLREFREDGRRYVVFDAETDEDLRRIVGLFAGGGYRIIWSGSAGLANCLTGSKQRDGFSLDKSEHPVLAVVGSVNQTTRKQLQLLLSSPGVAGAKLLAHRVVADPAETAAETASVFAEASARLGEGKHVVLYSSGEPEEIRLATEAGARAGLSATAVSDRISRELGAIAASLLRSHPVSRLILTGGDTAKQFCRFSGFKKFELIDEVETGVPIGIFSGERDVFGVTKAGGFGSDEVLLHALRILQEGGNVCVQ